MRTKDLAGARRSACITARRAAAEKLLMQYACNGGGASASTTPCHSSSRGAITPDPGAVLSQPPREEAVRRDTEGKKDHPEKQKPPAKTRKEGSTFPQDGFTPPPPLKRGSWLSIAAWKQAGVKVLPDKVCSQRSYEAFLSSNNARSSFVVGAFVSRSS